MSLNPPEETLLSQEKIYTVSRLNRETKVLLSQHLSSIRVEGEISNLAQPSSGHLYFTLKDGHAQVRCAMFKSRHRRTIFKPQNGQQVIVKADVSLFEQRGDYQLIVETMEEAGDGLLRLQFEQLMRKLSEEGLFDEDKKRALPRFPNTIGIVTSPSGAAIQDILAVFKRRAPHVQLNIYPAPVQGPDSEKALQKAIRLADRRGECDLLILARGGGSAEDLSLFNSEQVAKEIFNCKTPLITGIGHEIDFTIADFVADKRAATPSVAAESSCPDNEPLLTQLSQYRSLLVRRALTRLEQRTQHLSWLTKRLLQQHPKQQLFEKSQRLDDLDARIQKSIKSRLNLANSHLENRQNLLKGYHPHHNISLFQDRTNHLAQRLGIAIQSKTQQKRYKLSEAIRTLEAISPLSTLARGYAIVSEPKSQRLLCSADDIQIDQDINVRLSKGHLTCLVKETHHD